MKLILTPCVFLLTFCWIGLPVTSHAQERKIIPLNEHFFPVETGGGKHQYSKIVSISSEGERVEKVYTLAYSLVSITKSIFEDVNPKEALWEEKQQFSSNGELIYTQLKYRKAKSRHTKVLVGEKMILDLECSSFTKCDGLFVSSSGYREIVDRDIFKPSFLSHEVWQKFLMNNMTYPRAARNAKAEAEIWVGIKISEFGDIMESKIINESEPNPSLTKEVERILEKYDGGYIAARNLEGDYITAWMYFPIRFILG